MMRSDAKRNLIDTTRARAVLNMRRLCKALDAVCLAEGATYKTYKSAGYGLALGSLMGTDYNAHFDLERTGEGTFSRANGRLRFIYDLPRGHRKNRAEPKAGFDFVYCANEIIRHAKQIKADRAANDEGEAREARAHAALRGVKMPALHTVTANTRGTYTVVLRGLALDRVKAVAALMQEADAGKTEMP